MKIFGLLTRLNLKAVTSAVLSVLLCMSGIHLLGYPPELASAASGERLIVKFKASTDESTSDRLLAKHKVKKLEKHSKLGFHKVTLAVGENLNDKLQQLRNDPFVDYAEPDYRMTAAYVPNDPSYGSQWHLPKMNLPAAWDKTRGSSSVTIAIVDSGVDADHPDLTAKLVAGYNTINNTNQWNDDNGHGTHVAGIAAGSTDNGIGTAGVCIQCNIMPIKALGANGSGFTSDIAEGITWAADNGAKVINLSLGSPSNSTTMQTAINYAYNKGAVVIAAAGNENTSTPSYPAANNNVVAVAATNSSDQRASFSNFGAHIDVAAPGVSILAATFDGSYGYKQGTSMASPNVAGLAGLIMSYNPSMTPAQIEQLMKDTASDLGTAGKDDFFGFGLVNAQAAINGLTDSTAPSVPANLTGIARTTSVSLSWTASTDNVGVASYDVFRGTTNIGNTTSTGFTATGLTTNQNHTFSVRAKDAAGNVSASSTSTTVRTQASTNAYTHTITLDQTNDFNSNSNISGNETFSTSTANFFNYITWDSSHLYIGYSGADFASSGADANHKWISMYVGGSDGTTNGLTYNTQSPRLPFAAKYHVRWKLDGTYFNRQVFSNGAWTEGSTYSSAQFARNSATGYVELRIPRADLGNPSQLRFVSTVISEKSNAEWTWAASPADAISSDGYDRDLTRFYEFDLSSSVASASQVYNYQLTRTGNTATNASVSFSAQTGASSVKLEQSANGGSTWTDATTTASLGATSTVATITGLTANTDYKFRLSVVGGHFEGRSAILNESMFVDTQAPTAPTNLTLLDSNTTSIRFSWNASTDNLAVTGYEVYRGATLLETVTATQYTASGLTADTAYSFTVRARDAAGNWSAASSALNARTSPIITSFIHTITLDGTNDFFNSSHPNKKNNETFATSNNDMFSYVTWDASHIYFGYNSHDIRGITSNASQKWIWVYVGGAGGTTTGMNYAGQQPGLPFAAKYHLRFKVDGGYTNRQMWNGSAWQDMGNYTWGTDKARNDSNQFIEFKIPRSHLGMDTAKTMQWVSAIIYEDGGGNGDSMWAAVPSDSFINGFDRDFGTFYEFDLSSNSASASQVYNYQFRQTASTALSATFTFIAPSGATDVRIQQSVDNGVSWTTSSTSASLTSTSMTAVVTGLSPNVDYKFRLVVTGGASDGSSAIQSVRLAPDTVAPTVPTNVQATNITAFGLTLNWSASTDSNTGMKEYHVFNGNQLLGKTGNTSFVITGLNEYTNYSFTVRAEDVAGNLSGASAALSVTTQDVTAPNAPTFVEYSAVTANGFQISWSGASDAGSGVNGYEIYRNGTLVTTVNHPTTAYTFSGLPEFSSHIVNIKSKDTAGNTSDSSSSISVRTRDATAPTAPANLTASEIGANSFAISWDPSTDSGSGVNGYQIFNQGTAVTTTSATSYTFTELGEYSQHIITVRALDEDGNPSTASSPLTVRTSDVTAPTVPDGLSASAISSTGFTVSWNTSTDSGSGLKSYLVMLNSEEPVTVTAGTSHTFSHLQPFTDYSVKVSAVDQANNSSAYSSLLNVKTSTSWSGIGLSTSTVSENSPLQSVVGSLSVTGASPATVVTYQLIPGQGSADNGSFQISGTELRTSAIFNFEQKSSYSIRVRAADASGQSVEQGLTVTVTNVNEAPTEITLSSNAIPENAGGNAVVGTLSVTDPDSQDTFTYTLVSGTGDADNGSFQINGNQLLAKTGFNYEAKANLSIRVQVSDGTAVYAKSLLISVTNRNEAPTNVSLSQSSIAENNVPNASVGTLSGSDEDAGTSLSFSLVAGTGDSDNALFTIDGNQLRVNQSLNFEQKSAYSVRVEVSDGILTFARPIALTVTNVNEAPTLTSITDLSGSTEDQPFEITYQMLLAAANEADPDAGASLTFIVQHIHSGTLSKNGAAVSGGAVLAVGESFVWQGVLHAHGVLDAFSVKVSDGNLQSASPVTVKVAVTAINDVPVFNGLTELTGANSANPFPISHAMLLAAADITDPDSSSFSFVVQSVTSGTLTKNNQPVASEVTEISAGELFVWTPELSMNGKLAAFTIAVSDGSDRSVLTKTVMIEVIQSADVSKPTKPTSLTAPATDIKATQIRLTWGAGTDNTGIKEYNIYVNQQWLAKTNERTYTVTGLQKETSYTFGVTSVDTANLESADSAQLTVRTAKDVTRPSAPGAISIVSEQRSGTNVTLTISWEPASDDVGVAGYRVFLNNVQQKPDVLSAAGYTFSNLKHNTKYSISLRAIDRKNLDGSFNLSLSGAIFEHTTQGDTLAPHVPPTEALLTQILPASGWLRWQAAVDDVGVLGYRVYAAVAADSDGLKGDEPEVLIAESTRLATTVPLTPNREQRLRIAAVDAAGNESLRTVVFAPPFAFADKFVTSTDDQEPETPVGIMIQYVETTIENSALGQYRVIADRSFDNDLIEDYVLYDWDAGTQSASLISPDQTCTALTAQQICLLFAESKLTGKTIFLRARDRSGNLSVPSVRLPVSKPAGGYLQTGVSAVQFSGVVTKSKATVSYTTTVPVTVSLNVYSLLNGQRSSSPLTRGGVLLTNQAYAAGKRTHAIPAGSYANGTYLVEFVIRSAEQTRVYLASLIVDKTTPVIQAAVPSAPLMIHSGYVSNGVDIAPVLTLNHTYNLNKNALVNVQIVDGRNKTVHVIKSNRRLPVSANHLFSWDGAVNHTEDGKQYLPDGSYTALFSAVDFLRGKSRVNRLPFVIELQRPHLSLLTTHVRPASSITVSYRLSESVTIAQNAQLFTVDANGDPIAQVAGISISGVIGARSAGLNKFTIRGTLNPGIYKLRIIARDRVGKTNEVVDFLLHVDGVPPQIEGLQLSAATADEPGHIQFLLSEHARVTVSIRAGSETGPIVRMLADRQALNISASQQDFRSFTWNGRNARNVLVPDSSGTAVRYFVVIQAIDAAGNRSATVSQEIINNQFSD